MFELSYFWFLSWGVILIKLSIFRVSKEDVLWVRSNSAMQASPPLLNSEPEKDTVEQKLNKEKYIDEFDKEDVREHACNHLDFISQK